MAADRVSSELCGIECYPTEWGAITPSVEFTLSRPTECVTNPISGSSWSPPGTGQPSIRGDGGGRASLSAQLNGSPAHR